MTYDGEEAEEAAQSPPDDALFDVVRHTVDELEALTARLKSFLGGME